MFRNFMFTGMILLILLSNGCGSQGKGLKVEYVEGIITLDSEPVSNASITFIPITETDGTEAAGGYSNEKGVYKLTSGNGDPEKGALQGEYRVLVSKIESKDLTKGKEYGTPTGYQPTFKQTQLLPVIYQNREKSPLKATVKKGKNKIDFQLTQNPL
ncbi:MAG: hypothetical protein LBC02_01360 [Planctomycetaceae bacterium]|nr:hypothetical protein [Planctomycetaceae bacterium]